ncbi:hypothetical protein TUM4438_10450 [Shewanella sairae]|uniref:Restriction endonuclease type IV Mrr domain-containing protein n=1 Tax=Shewanella sairae TaxID=190310 RepID=A0ABQ4P5X3_9GAMM|nr:restriction endonuclease [Shewanella sairae]MCL1130479.1 restriction endonuclease [Shewanella sairae]GIU42875.1 hypothetical protein TUM4438_10450 [Shewanella sairae]
MTTLIYTLITAIVILLCLPVKRFCRHKHNISRANHALDTLSRIPHPGQQFAYLRKLDPFVFEELLLCAYERQGHTAIRNKRYTGDGGIDGQVQINKQTFLVQAKRYHGYIQAAHVTEFALVCRQHKKQGLFIHTGKTGKTAYIARCYGGIEIISGQKLLSLLVPAENKLKVVA